MGTNSAAIERAEQRALDISLVAMIVIGGGAVVWGLVTSTRVILFDGVFALAGLILVFVSKAAARAASEPPTARHPYGKHAAVPLAIALQSAALLGTVVYGALDAITLIIDGGADASATNILVYGAVTAIACLVVIALLRGPSAASELAMTEKVSWRVSFALSAVIGAGGLLGMLAGGATIARYIDPILVIVACAGILPTTVGLMRTAVRQLMEAAPDRPIRDEVAAAVARAQTPFGLPAPLIRSARLGRRLYVEIDYVIVDDDGWTVHDEDEVRRAVGAELGALDYEVWATVSITADPELSAD
ncbi:cobalt-zinc-cadmium resistance protein [Gordonia spumicola]|uniref:Cobalt-zinc-cadmium resistance protein n=1 Tax=Gordonia spumicola TaxID=589161 RepID=A0A7I9V388_9ACTN|nr:cation transporter [Gordonia spumicola]GED99875.1 cobalt-zinc-cadmium resistance protein [Gordonia spumicola]